MALAENNGVGGNRRWKRPSANAADWLSFPEIDADQEALLHQLGFHRVDQMARLSDEEIAVLQNEPVLKNLDIGALRGKCIDLNEQSSGKTGNWINRIVSNSVAWTDHGRKTIAFYWNSLWRSEEKPISGASTTPLSCTSSSAMERDHLEELPGSGVHVAYLLRSQGIHHVEDLGQLTSSEWRALALREPRLASFVALQLGESEEPSEDPFAVKLSMPKTAPIVEPIVFDSPLETEPTTEKSGNVKSDSEHVEPVKIETPARERKATPPKKKSRAGTTRPFSAKKTAARKKPASKKTATKKAPPKKAVVKKATPKRKTATKKAAPKKKAVAKKAPVKKTAAKKKTSLRIAFSSTTRDARKKSAASARLLAPGEARAANKKSGSKKTAASKKKAAAKKKSPAPKKAALRNKAAAPKKKASRASSQKKPVSGVPAAAQRLMTTEFAGQPVKYDKEVGIVYTKRPAKPDDLKKISGVGAVLEKKLHVFGVYRFKQIATWNKTMINAFDDRLNFKGRIERDDWVAQAKTLARK